MRRWSLPLVALVAALAVPGLSRAADWAGTATLGPTGDPDSYGSSTISLVGSQLTVFVEVFGLDPNTTHASHIHTGTCSAQGPVYIGLQSITVDATGHGSATSMITLDPTKTMDLPLFARYVNVHHQTTGAGITCGNVVWSPTPVEPITWGRLKSLYR